MLHGTKFVAHIFFLIIWKILELKQDAILQSFSVEMVKILLKRQIESVSHSHTFFQISIL